MPMPRPVLHFVAAVITAAALGSAATIARSAEQPPAPPTRRDAEIREQDIAFYRGRVERDPHGAADRAQLARLYLERAREGGDPTDLVRAERSARRSLSLRRGRNGAALAVLASSLLGQHRFVEALATAEQLLALDSTSAGARSMVGEVQMELGRYDDARRSFGMLAMRRSEPAVAPRYARWEEVTGRPEEARRLLREARDLAAGLHGVPAEQLAWFQLRLGELAMRQGRLKEAGREFARGLSLLPADYRLLGAMARLQLASGRPRDAIGYGERALGGTLDPTTLGVLHDAYAAAGDSARAEQYARAMEVAVLNQPGALHRAWSMFLLDRGQDVAGVLTRAAGEIRTRHDVYGWDLLGWALHRAGRHTEAQAAAANALALGTRDAVLHYHAGMIALSLSDTAEARRQLRRALAVNPYWHPSQPRATEALLDSL
jgi:tetratricopeptide (TPR) repeat protein